MDKKLAPYTFNNVDPEKRRVIITPRGPDPILFGIRGETPEAVKKAFELVKPLEPVERWVIFRSNQGTDAHLKHAQALSDIEPIQFRDRQRRSFPKPTDCSPSSRYLLNTG